MYYSRKYLNEKWQKMKWDMEKVLQVDDKDAPDAIDGHDIERVRDNIITSANMIVTELLG